jgi:hypothetical protein
VARHQRFQGRCLTQDERGVVVCRTRQATRMVEHDQISLRCRKLQLLLQPGLLRCVH